ncbi:2-acylglycerophosphoethanolamine acyltransferase / Acyl-[acyl-carrier-protein] synthetase, partial [hydrothermal vent metagenome]
MVAVILRRLLKLFYRVEVKGLDYFHQSSKRTMIVANHTSFLDAALLYCFLPDDISFAIHTRIMSRGFMAPFRSMVKLFVMDPANPFSLKSLIKYLKEDNRVVIFPEGRITTTGALMKIYNGPGLVADRSDADVLPIRIDGAQYTPFSRLRGIVRLRWFPKITLTILPPRKIKAPDIIRGRARRYFAGKLLTDIMNEVIFSTSNYKRTLFQALLDAKNIHGKKHIIAEDIERSPISYQQLIHRSILLGDVLEPKTQEGEYVGILLPNMVNTVVTFFALHVHGRIPVMLNFSAGAKAMLNACTTTNIKTVYTSKRFVTYAKLDAVIEQLSQQVNVCYLEDIVKKISALKKLTSIISATFPKATYIKRLANHNPHSPAVVLFTSGSEGVAKGVVLSHSNLLANGIQMSTRVDFNAQDKILNSLPLFHSFGLTAGTLIPLISGMKVFLYPSPLHYRIIPEVAYDIGATIMFGTNTFLANYGRFAHPYDFYSLRYVFSGAEKLQDTTRQLWNDKFGVRVFEGYGTTETSPALSTNTAMDNKKGTVGRLLP